MLGILAGKGSLLLVLGNSHWTSSRQSSIYTGLLWGFPCLGERRCSWPLSECPAAQLGIGYILGLLRFGSLEWERVRERDVLCLGKAAGLWRAGPT